jgi:hypothetical protein
MNFVDPKTTGKCWCEFPEGNCPDWTCEEAFPKHESHRERILVAVHWWGKDRVVQQPSAIWGEGKGEIKYCPVCGKKLRGRFGKTKAS